MEIPFDNNSGEKYVIDVVTSDIETGDGVVLTLNKKACEAFAKIFSELAKGSDGTHVHLGYDESEPQGPGLRLVLSDNT
ncbi:hypothetical protein [Marinobacter lutaoensis]|uniref:hypothetical protein n=1 Tax=Marinobacter lutaoensis TaxID=135739 RepID=UPI0011155FCE|nr:hypothetical protein [Marinobacter lutaoensis]